jgi:cytochrome c oxidase subunit II
MVVAVLMFLVAIGSVVFHVLSPWWWTPIASNWGYIDTTLVITFWITGAAFVLVVGFMAYCIWKYRYKPGQTALYEPENKKLESQLTIATALGVAAMLAPGLYVWHQFVTVPKDATDVEVVARQWSWSYRLPGQDGKLGTSDTRLVSAENPLGVNPEDPNGKDDVVIESGDLHLQLNKPVKLLLRAVDVLHDFYVPEFRGKMDMIPGSVTYFWMTPTRTGTFDILCAELCGVGHSQMRGSVVVADDAAYRGWLEKQKTFAELSGAPKTMKASLEPAAK